MKFLIHSGAAAAAVALSALVAMGSASAADLPDYVAPPEAVAPAGWAAGTSARRRIRLGQQPGVLLRADDITNWQALNINLNGGLLGATLGFNFTPQNNFVLGIEGDISFGRLGGTQFLPENDGVLDDDDPGFNPSDTFGEYHQSYLATLRARLGWVSTAFGNPTLWYVTGGLATTTLYREITNENVIDSNSSATHTGWTVGAGLETMIAPHGR